MKKLIKNIAFYKVFIITIIIATLSLPLASFGQLIQQGSIQYLASNNGFYGIGLGADIKQLDNTKLAYMDNDSRVDADSCVKYVYRDTNMMKIGNDLSLDMIGLRTYKNKVVNIYLFFKQADAYKVLRNFLVDYGPYTDKPSEYVDTYNWNGGLVNLTLLYQDKNNMGVAIFTCNPIDKQLAENRELARQRNSAMISSNRIPSLRRTVPLLPQ